MRQAWFTPRKRGLPTHATISVTNAVHGGLPGVRIDIPENIRTKTKSLWPLRPIHGEPGAAAYFLFSNADGEPRVACAYQTSGCGLGTKLDEVVGGPDLGLPAGGDLMPFLMGYDERCVGSINHREALRVADAVRGAIEGSGLPEHLRLAFRCFEGWPTGIMERVALELMVPAADDGRSLALSNPLGYLVRRGFETEGTIGSTRGPVSLAPATMRRLSKFGPEAFLEGDYPVDIPDLGRFASKVPVDWVPNGDIGAIRAFVAASRMCAPAIHLYGLRIADLTRSAAGDWPAFVERCRKAAGNHSSPEEGDAEGDEITRVVHISMRDAAHAFAWAVLQPLAIRAGMEPAPERPLAGVESRAFEILYGGKSLPACIEEAVRWHRHWPGFAAALPSDLDDRTWPALHPVIEDGPYDIVPLTSSRDLMHEGSNRCDPQGIPGMNHCIGGVHYRSKGALRQSHFVSVRLRGPDNGAQYERVATAELVFDGGRLHAVQIQGPGDKPVTSELRAMIHRYMDRPVQPVKAIYDDGEPSSIRSQIGYDLYDDALVTQSIRAWEPFLPKEWRGLSCEDFSSKVGFETVVSGLHAK